MFSITRVAARTAMAVILVYAADAAWVRLRTLARRDPTSIVQVRVTLAVPQKDGRVEFIPGGTEVQSCVRAMFPHLGLEPCWYVERHTRRQIDF